jgi:hypothetical protein
MDGNGNGSGSGERNGDRTAIAPPAVGPGATWRAPVVLGASAVAIAALAGGIGFVLGDSSAPKAPAVASATSTSGRSGAARACQTPNQGIPPVVGRVETATKDVITIGGGPNPTFRAIVLRSTKVCRMQPGTLDDIVAGDAVAVQGPRRSRGVVEARQVTIVPQGVSGRGR